MSGTKLEPKKQEAFLSYFWDLADDSLEKRLAASEKLLLHVKTAISTQEARNEAGTLVSDLDYTLKRLIRGLSSSRNSARHGFATCLTSLLREGHISLSDTLDMMEEYTKVNFKHYTLQCAGFCACWIKHTRGQSCWDLKIDCNHFGIAQMLWAILSPPLPFLQVSIIPNYCWT